MSSKLVSRRVHTDTGALSLLITNYAFSLITLVMINSHSINVARLVLTTALAALNIVSLVKAHLGLISRRGLRDYSLFLINTAPYLALIPYLGIWLVIPPLVPLALFIVEIVRGRGRSVLANVSGTALIASTYLAWYVLMGGNLVFKVIMASLTWIIYHAFSALYVEGKLPFRQGIKPHYSSLLWFMGLPALAYGIYIVGGLLPLIVLIEPTIRALIAVREDKLPMNDLRRRVRRIGVELLIESLVLAGLILILLYALA
ncbi:hypothetical protein [Vulcanisaeta distributa]|uniref:hypothetical protein n=1 Tax=Vulcanisaeta distributa TaxID=164451 RepID=UPI0006D08639|nr:hypothetical protein [Vulcanisaeta distributa]